MTLPTDDLLGRVYEQRLYTGNTVSGLTIFTVQEVRPEKDEVIVVEHEHMTRQTLPLAEFSRLVWEGEDIWESALPPYGQR